MFLLTPIVFHDHRRQSSHRLPQHHYKHSSEQAGGFKWLISLTDSMDQPIDRPLWHTVTIAIIETLWEAEGTSVKGHHTIFLPFAGQRQGRDGKRRHTLKDMRRFLWSAFTKHQLLFSIPLNNLNPPPRLTGHPSIKPKDLSLSLPLHPFVAKVQSAWQQDFSIKYFKKAETSRVQIEDPLRASKKFLESLGNMKRKNIHIILKYKINLY